MRAEQSVRQCGCYVATCDCGWRFHGPYSETMDAVRGHAKGHKVGRTAAYVTGPSGGMATGGNVPIGPDDRDVS